MTAQTPLKNHKFNFKTTSKQVMKGISLTGRHIIVTGGYSGIGLEAVRQLSKAGAAIIVPARRLDTAQNALSKLKNVTVAELDLQNPDSIKTFSDFVHNKFNKLDILINSAGIMYVPLVRDSRGIESHFSTNHLGHFKLTLLLSDLLERSGHARVINVSSRAHQSTPLLDNWNFTDDRSYTPQIGYQQSKTANVLFTIGLDERYRGSGIRSFAIHPGMIPTTGIGREQFAIKSWQRRLAEKSQIIRVFDFFRGIKVGFDRSKYRYFKTISQGAATMLWAAASSDLDGMGGLYLEDVNIARIMSEDEPDNFKGGVRAYAIDSTAAKRLWDISAGIALPTST